MGHGALYRLHADNRFETIMAPGRGRQAGIFRPIIAPAGWGDWGGHIFFGSQIVPGRSGAVLDHMLYRLAPGESTPHPFAIFPRAGVRGDGISGALLPGVFGRPGTSEEGLLLVHSLHNCVIYAVRPDGSVTPWIIMDGVNGPGPVMPYRLFYAPEFLVAERNFLVIEGQWGTSFGDQIRDKFTSGHFHVVGRTVNPDPVASLNGGIGPVAPEAFGPFAGQMFRTQDAGFLSAIHWTPAERKPLPYTTSIVRREADGSVHTFASQLQAGQNLIGFTANRMIITNLRHSYSTGDYHEPDGSIYEIRFNDGKGVP
jgi:hypothetical protein